MLLVASWDLVATSPSLMTFWTGSRGTLKRCYAAMNADGSLAGASARKWRYEQIRTKVWVREREDMV